MMQQNKLNIYIKSEILDKLRVMAFEQEKSMSAIVRELIEAAPSPDGKWFEHWLKEQKSKEA